MEGLLSTGPRPTLSSLQKERKSYLPFCSVSSLNAGRYVTLLLGMRFKMSFKAARLRECFITLVTDRRLFSNVSIFMYFQAVRPRECLFTLRADIMSVAGMRYFVRLKVVRIR